MYPSYFSNENKEYYSIKIEHPLLNYQGLTAVTTGQLEEWWNKQYRGKYINRNFLTQNPFYNPFDPIFGDEYQDAETTSQFLNIVFPIDNGVDNYTFKAWRKMGHNGKNVYYYGPNLKTGGSVFDKWAFFENTNFGGGAGYPDRFCGGDDSNSENLYGANIIYKYEDLGWELGCVSVDEPKGPSGAYYPLWFRQLINSYNTVIEHGYATTYDESQWPKCIRARKTLAEDIMVGGGLVWSGVLGFKVDIGNISCTKYETVKYTLQFLEPTNLKKRNDNLVAMKKLFISGPASDTFGRKTINSNDGGYTNVTNEDDMSQHQAGELSVTWNPVEKKYESGTLQCPAIIAVDIPAANNRSSDFLDSVNVAEMLGDPTAENYLNMTTGVAIPLTNTNGNPSLLTPTYDQEEGCRENEDKLKLVVYNPYPRPFLKDTNVILSKINGIWIPMDVGKVEQEIENEFLGKWDFSYFMTNAEFYFTDRYKSQDNTGAMRYRSFTYTNYEDSMRQNVFDFDKNVRQQYKDDNQIYERNVSSTIVIGPNPWGFWHITSWDFMGTQMGGTRIGGTGTPGNALAATTYGYTLETDEQKAGTKTNPFFGCTFPDGYDPDTLKNKYRRYSNKEKPISIDRLGSDNYLSNVVDSTKIFDDSYNVNIEANVDPSDPTKKNNGMFFALNNGKSFTGRHIPADIGCNSSRCLNFDNQNGAPLKNFNLIAQYLTAGYDIHNTALGSNSTIFNVCDTETLFNDQNFYNFFIETKKSELEEDNPVWNLKPLVPNRIQFRPMTMELYASAEWRFLLLPEFQRRMNIEKITQAPPGNPIPPNNTPSWESPYLKQIDAAYDTQDDPRLNHDIPNMVNKNVGGCRWIATQSMVDSRGRFGIRAGLMVKDFMKLDGSTYSSFKYDDGFGNSPLWGSANNVATRNRGWKNNILDSDGVEVYTLEAGRRWADFAKFNNSSGGRRRGVPEVGDPFAYDRFCFCVWNGQNYAENYFFIKPFDVTYQGNDFNCSPGPGVNGAVAVPFFALPYVMPNDSIIECIDGRKLIFDGNSVVEGPYNLPYLGLAYGAWDYWHKGKLYHLEHTTTSDRNNLLSWRQDIYSRTLNLPESVAGPAAIGVIGAQCTVKILSPRGLTIQNQYQYGIPVDMGSRVPGFRDLDGDAGLYQTNTTGLYARVFQYWPRHLTVYDPRFFAIHHFNDGIGMRFDELEKLYFTYGFLNSMPTEEEKEAAETQDYPRNFTYSKAATSVDIRTPTLYNGDPLEENSIVLYDAIDGDKDKKLRKKEHWNINDTAKRGAGNLDGRNRRGRLLPYTYVKKTVSLAAGDTDAAKVIGLTVADPPIKVSDLNLEDPSKIYLLILDNGINYQVGDTFTCTAGTNSLFTVTEVAPEDNNPYPGVKQGAILGLECSNKGLDFGPLDFMKIDTILNKKAKSGAKLVNLTAKSGGSLFTAYVIRGVCDTVELTDSKPKQIGGLIKLTSPNNGGNGIVNAYRETIVPIPAKDKSSTNLYDVFLHFHNDAAHVLGHNWAFNLQEQYMNVTII